MKTKEDNTMIKPKIHEGDLVAQAGKIYDFKEVTGYLYANGADTKTAFPKLTTIGGSLDADGADTKTAFPKLTTIGGSLYADGADTKTAFPKLTTIGGSLDANGADTKTAFPKLTTIGGFLYARGADTKTAFPKLTTIGGSLDADGADTKTAFPKLTTIGGFLDANGADTKTAFPKLTTIGGSLYARGADTKTAFPKLIQQNDPRASAICSAALAAALLLNGFVFHDGILSQIVSTRRGLSKVVRVGQTKISYVIEQNGITAHGDDLAQARADLLFKMGSRDTSQFKTWKLITVRSLEELIAAYRAITGACGAGVSHFLNGKKLPPKITVDRAIKETEGQFGHDKFKAFFTK